MGYRTATCDPGNIELSAASLSLPITNQASHLRRARIRALPSVIQHPVNASRIQLTRIRHISETSLANYPEFRLNDIAQIFHELTDTS